jgi:DNA polymerase V
MKKVFALIDCNNFFVSCERLFTPKARNNPAVVFSNNDGCVIARSNEAKLVGIRMAEPVFECRELMNFFNVVGFSTNFSLYSDLSNRIAEILQTFCPEIEIYSIDESFLELTNLQIDNYENFGNEIKEKVYQLTGIPVSVGIAPTKTLAKLCSKLAKQGNGVFVYPNDSEYFLKNFDIGDVWGIGRASSLKLKKINVNNVFDYINLSSQWILKNFGVLGLRTWWELKGKSAISLNQIKEIPKSMAHTRTFKNPISDKLTLSAKLYEYACEISTSLRESSLLAGEITIFLREGRSAGYHGVSLSKKISDYTNLRTDLCKEVTVLFDNIFQGERKYKKGGVIVTKIIKEVDKNRFFSVDNQKKDNAEKGVDILNKRWKGLVKLGIQSFEKPIYSNFKSREFTTNWQELCSVF